MEGGDPAGRAAGRAWETGVGLGWVAVPDRLELRVEAGWLEPEQEERIIGQAVAVF